jgi:GTP-binding protein EngB required for normal cell division
MSIKNILLIGRTGSGKSTLANTLINQGNNFEEVFKESSESISETKNIQSKGFTINIKEDGSEKIRYLVIDTAGFGDTQLTNKEVLQLLEGLAEVIKDEGLNQIFFVTDGRFTKTEIETYQILESVLFDQEAVKYTTIIRTRFPDFENGDNCDSDRKKLREENSELLGILKSSKVIYVDNPPMQGRYIEMAKDTRAESRKRVITYLGTCQETYKPSNLNELNQRINNYKTKTEQLENEIKTKQQIIKDQEAKLQRDIQAAKTQQQNELENNRRNFDQQIQNSRSSYDQQLQNTRNQLQSNYQAQISSSQQRFNNELNEINARHQRELEEMKFIIEIHYLCPRNH